jgi:7,8-dihydropterin-6-yl-methyl-4-(beta-D-ribofuranosyl)aminobenzene 5'-phosphate synthase
MVVELPMRKSLINCWPIKRSNYLHLLVAGLLFGCNPDSHQESTEKRKEPTVTKEFTITNLYDAFGKTRNGLTKDFGFSALISYRGKLILFDAGTNADILKSNVETMGFDLAQVDYAIASHAHGDHINGFDYLLEVNPEVKIYLPFDFFTGAKINFNVTGKEQAIIDSLPEEMRYFGGEKDLNLTINQSGRFWKANVEFVRENMKLQEGVTLIATRSPFLGYGSKYPSVDEMKFFGSEEMQSNNEITFVGLPELSLSLSSNDGEVLVVGCSHSSVQNIISAVKENSTSDISLVYGGYHMLPYGREEINTIVNSLKSHYGVKRVAPAHCTGHLAFKLLKDGYGKDYIYAGLGETITL